MSTSIPTCPRCGARLESADATCARCVLERALAAATPVREASERPSPPSSAARPARPPTPTPAELAPLFPELEIEGLLGEGGMGAVYRAKQRKLGRTVALKLLHADLSADPAFVARFLREASALARLAHPGIVSVHEYGEQGARCWLVMEYVDGTNLRALLREKKLEPRQALAIVRQLCDALQFAHDEGVVHRDIKPENVLVDRRGNVKLADFGLAKLVGAPEAHLTQADQVMGTPHYMAPEQLERPRDVDHRADLYSLGVVFYEMLTGELPLGRFAPPSQRVEVDVRLDEIVLRALEHERERRYQHAVQVKTDVQRVEETRAPAAEAEAEVGREPGVFVWGLEGGEHGLRKVPGNHVPGPGAWFSILFVAWLVCGASFNLGPLGFAGLSIPLFSWLFLSLVRHRRGWTEPKAQRELEKRRFTALACLVPGFLCMCGAFVGSWDRFTFDYSAPAARAGAGFEALQGQELETLRSLDAELDLAPLRPALRLRSAFVQDPPEILLRSPLTLSAAALSLLALAAWYWARPAARHALELVATSLFLFLGPLSCAVFLNLLLCGFSSSGTAVRAGPEFAAEGLAPVASRLHDALLDEDWQVSSEHDGLIVDRLTGIELAEVRTLVAAPPSLSTAGACRGAVRSGANPRCSSRSSPGPTPAVLRAPTSSPTAVWRRPVPPRSGARSCSASCRAREGAAPDGRRPGANELAALC